MSVLIKDMQMPKSCGSCKLFGASHAIGLFSPLGWCRVNGKEIFRLSEKADFCPLVEVPEPHGRLIDADKLKSYWEPDHSRYFDADYFIHTIDVAKAIIPASEDEIDEAQRDYQAAADYQQYCETYEQTYDPDTGAM